MSQAIALTSWTCIFGSMDMWASSYAASLLMALEEAAEAELRAAMLGA
jgi:hypothetical protein